ncbi:DUF262 domain-containing protein [Acidithiobacillus marinus]|nr:DUF262 domain-containing protein [Acidithiobacillus marinus]
MHALTTLRALMSDKEIHVPSYQRAYSWDTPIKKYGNDHTQTDEFLTDLETYSNARQHTPYHFGTFLFEKNGQVLKVIDGQQRLTTIVMFLSALFSRLESIRTWSEAEKACYGDMLRQGELIRFSTVDRDQQIFIDYVIKQSNCDHTRLETESAWRIVRAFDYFKQQLADKSEAYLVKMLSVVSGATCVVHLVHQKSDAMQMFILQNARGKPPLNVELVKTLFMHHVNTPGSASDEQDALSEKVRQCFEKIHHLSWLAEYGTSADDILLIALQVYTHALWVCLDPLAQVKRLLHKDRSNDFVANFSGLLSSTCDLLENFFGEWSFQNADIHSLVSLGDINMALPFVLKAYLYGLPLAEIGQLSRALESIILRDKLIGEGDLHVVLGDVFSRFTKADNDLSPIITQIDWMKTADHSLFGSWSNSKLHELLQHWSPDEHLATFLLWKYEMLLEQQINGSSRHLWAKLGEFELDYIGHPCITEQDDYAHDSEYVVRGTTLGNMMLCSKSDRCELGKTPVAQKLPGYIHNEQQKEVKRLVAENAAWSGALMGQRNDTIITHIISAL